MSQHLSQLPKWRLERILRIADISGRSRLFKRSELISKCKRVLKRKRQTEDDESSHSTNYGFSWRQIPIELIKSEILPHMTLETLIKLGPTGKLELELVQSILHDKQLTVDMVLAPPILLSITITMPIWGLSLFPIDYIRLKQLIRDIFRLDLQTPLLSDINTLTGEPWSTIPGPKYVLMCSIKVISRVKHYILVYDDLDVLVRIKRYVFSKYNLVTNIRNFNKYWCPKECLTL